jgi:hypothetical protein
MSLASILKNQMMIPNQLPRKIMLSFLQINGVLTKHFFAPLPHEKYLF